MVEGAVNIVYTNVYALLRNHQHPSLEQLNHAIKDKLHDLNHKPYRKTTYSRRHLFGQHELHLLKLLPPEPFTAKKTDMASVQRNYHIQLKEDKLYYSVPYTYVGKKVKVLYDDRTVEVYCDHSRIALHIRSRAVKGWSTLPEHMPLITSKCIK